MHVNRLEFPIEKDLDVPSLKRVHEDSSATEDLAPKRTLALMIHSVHPKILVFSLIAKPVVSALTLVTPLSAVQMLTVRLLTTLVSVFAMNHSLEMHMTLNTGALCFHRKHFLAHQMNRVPMELFADLSSMAKNRALILVKMYSVALMLDAKLLIDDLNVSALKLAWMVIHLIFNMDASHLFASTTLDVARMKFALAFPIAKNTLYTNVKMFVEDLNVAPMLSVAA